MIKNGKRVITWSDVENHWYWWGRYMAACLALFLIAYYGLPWLYDVAREAKEYREAHPLPPTPVSIGYEVKYEDEHLQKVWIYNDKGLEYISQQVAEGWKAGAKHNLFMGCWNYNSCDEILLTK